jgi:hypothetical protein
LNRFTGNLQLDFITSGVHLFTFSFMTKERAAATMEKVGSSGKSVERLFPFLVRARKLIVGREALVRGRRRLHSILIATDLSENSKAEILREFADYPILQKYSSGEFDEFFGVRNAKVLGLEKSSLAQSIYAELKESRVNALRPQKPGESASNA